ncbi:hypothetical protein Tco_0995940 [Tanacetum coccineum]
MNNTITALSIQTNQVINHGTERQANQFGREAKVEFPKFHGDDIVGENVGWDAHKEEIIQRFGLDFKDADLKNARYDKTAKEYQDLFDTLLCRVDPKTLSGAYCLTNLQEATLEDIKKKNNPLGSHTGSGFRLSGSNKPPVLPLPYTNRRKLFSLVVLPMKELEEEFQDEEEEL